MTRTINIRVEIPDPEQTLEVDDDMTEDEIEEAVREFAAEHASQTYTVEWDRD